MPLVPNIGKKDDVFLEGVVVRGKPIIAPGTSLFHRIEYNMLSSGAK